MSSWRKSATACKRSGNALLPSGRLAVKSNVAIDDICSLGLSRANEQLLLGGNAARLFSLPAD